MSHPWGTSPVAVVPPLGRAGTTAARQNHQSATEVNRSVRHRVALNHRAGWWAIWNRGAADTGTNRRERPVPQAQGTNGPNPLARRTADRRQILALRVASNVAKIPAAVPAACHDQ